MTFGLTIEKILMIGLIAALIIGPERLPAAAESLGRLVRQVRDLARRAQDRLREEAGPEVADIDWQRLDPRQYDPRRIVREALLADSPLAPAAPAPGVRAPAAPASASPPAAPAPAPAPAGPAPAPGVETASP